MSAQDSDTGNIRQTVIVEFCQHCHGIVRDGMCLKCRRPVSQKSGSK